MVPTRPQPTSHTREQHPDEQAVGKGAKKDSLPTPGEYRLQKVLQRAAPSSALDINLPVFVVLAQLLTFALELETQIIKAQIGKHNSLMLVLLMKEGKENTFFFFLSK